MKKFLYALCIYFLCAFSNVYSENLLIDTAAKKTMKTNKITNQKLISIAILKAKPGKADELKSMLLALIEPTRAEEGNLDYVLFELADDPGTFYMREAFVNREALDAHFAAPYFQGFAAQMDGVLSEPIKLQFLNQISQ